MPALYSTEARASGGRLGHVATNDGLLSVDLTAPKELGGKGGATNPEQLFAAGYAACFDSASAISRPSLGGLISMASNAMRPASLAESPCRCATSRASIGNGKFMCAPASGE